jgi:hypothetical protein
VKAVHDQRGWDALIAIGYSIYSRGRAILKRLVDILVPASRKLESFGHHLLDVARGPGLPCHGALKPRSTPGNQV